MWYKKYWGLQKKPFRKDQRSFGPEMVVGYTVEGEPLTKESYNKRLEAEKQTGQ
jgi:hypothetical protein